MISKFLFSLSVFLSFAGLGLAIPRAASNTPQDDDDNPLPLVIWHGLGDNYKSEGILSIGDLADSVHPGTFVYNVYLNEDPSADRTASYFGNLTEQIQQVCQDLASHPILSTAPAIDALGFSQGGQFLRAYVERCNRPPVRSLVTFGSQHNGISRFQNCEATDWLCQGANGLLRGSTWGSFVQSRLVPAQYYRDPEDLESYLEYSNFLADINNERPLKNPTYKTNLASLKNFVMYIFEDDTTVIPKESAWFAEVNSTSSKVTKLEDRPIFKEDWLGLRELAEKKALKFLSTPGRHMLVTEDLLEEVFRNFFGYLGDKGDKKLEHKEL
ncbi:MAG: hypothetical protein M1829_005482 [Trizodia sp. TS-e1964]|nr:MAG: hypothetical protein M1829_005482 [Trizodia sp. TS-e1964]